MKTVRPSGGGGSEPGQRRAEPETVLLRDGETCAEASPPSVHGWPAPADWRYHPVAALGAGGMGIVFKAWDETLKRHVAIKFLTGDQHELRSRFVREARAQARVDHPGICKVYEVGEVGARHYIAMQLIAGSPLSALAASLTLEQKVLAVKQVAEAVHAAHRVGLIHRDVKPANIMVEAGEDGEPRPYVVDFGLVRELGGEALTVDGLTIGTPSFMAPEQARGDLARIDRRTDVYGLGATLYAVLAGRPPFAASMPLEVMRQVLDQDPAPLRQVAPGVPADLETVVMKCLEKEPEQRYESARALAEELARFLDGEPVWARPGGALYRAGKWVRRNRALAAGAALALVVSASLGAVALDSRWTAARQAALAQRFGADVREIESILRFAHLLPLHDTRPERALARERLDRLERDVGVAGRAGQGPAHAALGRAWLALGEHRRAREHLERAWVTLRYREPEVAYALGLTLVRLHELERRAAERIGNRDLRERRLTELDEAYRAPARAYLEASRGAGSDATEYLEGLLALLDGRHEDALSGARAAQARLPWLYEAGLLEAEAHLARGRAAEDGGRLEEAMEAYGAASSALIAAARIGASDDVLLIARAAALLRIARLGAARGSEPEELIAQARELCDEAIAVNPEAPSGYLYHALASSQLGTFQAAHAGAEASVSFRDAARWAREAIARDSEDPEAHRVLGWALSDLATYQVDHGQDPTVALEEAIVALARAVSLDPRAVHAYNSLGIAYWNTGAHRATTGADPLSAYRQAAVQFERALDVDPSHVNARANLAGVQQSIAMAEASAGTDPRPMLLRSIESYRKVIDVRPEIALLHSNSSNAWRNIAGHALTHGEDPGEALTRAVEASRAAIAADPTYFLAFENLGEAFILEGMWREARGEDAREVLQQAVAALEERVRIHPDYPARLGEALVQLAGHELRHGRDPEPALARGLELLRAAIREAPAAPWPHTVLGRLELLQARAAAAQGRSPARGLEAARRALSRALELNPGSTTALVALAEACRREAGWQRNASAAAAAIEGGLVEIERALAGHPEDTAALAERAALLIGRARLGVGGAGHGDDPRAALARVLEANPLLRPEYRALLEVGSSR